LKIMVRAASDRLPAYDRFPALDLDLASAERVSPLSLVSDDDAPSLLLAGDKDDLVPIEHSRRIHAAFEKAGVTTKLVVLEGAGHGFAGADLARAVSEMVSWFDLHLAKR
jgi:dipeptidyl aminopeptidase/acylaminoacyl peptidase